MVKTWSEVYELLPQAEVKGRALLGAVMWSAVVHKPNVAQQIIAGPQSLASIAAALDRHGVDLPRAALDLIRKTPPIAPAPVGSVGQYQA